MDSHEHAPGVYPIWGITDDTCWFAMCTDCGWLNEPRATFDEAEVDVQSHRWRVEDGATM